MKRFRFELVETSREPGVCLNWPLGAKDADPDLRLAHAGTGGELSAEDQKLALKQPPKDDKQQPYAEVKIESYDFGGRAELLDCWERGWGILLGTLQCLTPSDLEMTITIRGEPHTVPLALARSLGHTCYHVGQIVQVARIHAGDSWNTLTIPRGQSEQFNQAHWGHSGKSHS